MGTDYLPVLFSIDEYPPELEQWVASRFEVLNGRRVHIVRNKDFPADARDVHPYCLQPWIWDVVPKDTERVLYVDSDMIPLRALPELPDDEFIAALDGTPHCKRMADIYPAVAADGNFFNSGFFVASRSLRHIFDQMKFFVSSRKSEDPRHGDHLQTIFNLLIRSATSIKWLPHDYNSVAITATPKMMSTAISLHLCAMPLNARWVIMNALRTSIGLSKFE